MQMFSSRSWLNIGISPILPYCGHAWISQSSRAPANEKGRLTGVDPTPAATSPSVCLSKSTGDTSAMQPGFLV
jgi:hypothetical protein